MKINESKYRSPKWIRNFMDFELNTGEDISGEPSKKRQKIDEEEREKREKIKKEEEKFEEDRKFNRLWKSIYSFINNNYETCIKKVEIKNNIIKITSSTLVSEEYGDIYINIYYKNSIIPDFNVEIFEIYDGYDNILYGYNMKGISYSYMVEFINKITRWWNVIGYRKHDYKKKDENQFKDEKTKNKYRRYELLLKTLDGYKREMEKIKEWERVNKKYHSDRKTVENEINAVKRRIEEMKKEYHFEKIDYDFIELNLIDINNKIKNIKNDLDIFIYNEK